MRRYEKDLPDAWAFIKEYFEIITQGMTSSKSIAPERTAIAVAIGVSDRSFRAWLEDEEFVKTSVRQLNRSDVSERTRRIVEFYYGVAEIGDKFWRLANIASTLLEIDGGDFSYIRRYEGSHKLVRIGKEDRFILGDVTISNEDGSRPYMHLHESIQKIDGRNIKFSHQGPIFDVSGRLYFLAIGKNESRYFRPMILRAVDEPQREVTFGVMLTETFKNLTPMGSMVAMLPEEAWRDASEQLKSDIEIALHPKSDSRGMIYGDVRVLIETPAKSNKH